MDDHRIEKSAEEPDAITEILYSPQLRTSLRKEQTLGADVVAEANEFDYDLMSDDEVSDDENKTFSLIHTDDGGASRRSTWAPSRAAARARARRRGIRPSLGSRASRQGA